MNNQIKTFGLKTAYNVLSRLTQNKRIYFLIKLKIAIGIALVGNKTASAQTVEFPNQANVPDTLNLDIVLDEEILTMCYEVVVVANSKEKEPKYPGGQRALNKFVREHVQYPEEALKHGVEGDIAVLVTVNEEGEITNKAIIKEKGYGLDEEALRLVSMMPNLKPGKRNKEKRSMTKTIIFHFELPQE